MTIRASPAGVSSNAANLIGVFTAFVVITGGVSAWQVGRTHAALAQAAVAAVQSEQQAGCWTSTATQAVYQTLKGAGINPATVAVTAATAQSTSYGQTVTAGLATHVAVRILGAALWSVPVQAQTTGTSFWTPAIAGGTNPACVSPAPCPTVTTVQQSCRPVTTEQCTTAIQTICGTTEQEQCGWSGGWMYSCTNQPRCSWQSTEVCTTQEVYGVEFCWALGNGPQHCVYGDHPQQVCSPERHEVCTTTTQCGEHYQSYYACHTVPVQSCRQQPTQSCHPVTTTQCTDVPVTTNECG